MNSIDFSNPNISEELFQIIFVKPDADRLAQMFLDGKVFRDPKLKEVFNHLSVSSFMYKMLNDCRIDFSNPEVRENIQACIAIFSEAGDIHADYIRDMADATTSHFGKRIVAMKPK